METAALERAARARAPLTLSEDELVSRVRQGDGTAFEAIMRRHNRLLFRTARGILKHDTDAEEVVQETYLKAYAYLDGFARNSRLSTWLVKIAVNESLSRLRRRMPVTNLESLSDEMMVDPERQAHPAPRVPENPESAAARNEIRRLLELAIDDLPQAQRAVFMLRAIEEFSVEDTSDCLGIPKDTVKTRFHRAKRHLRRALSETLGSALADTFPFAGRRCDRIVAGVLGRLGLESRGLSPPERP